MCVTFILSYSTGAIVFLGVDHQLKEIHSTLKVDIYENSFDYISESSDIHITVYIHTCTDRHTLCLLVSRLDLIFCSAA